MDNYILLKDLPDATKGTMLIWDEGANSFYYNKSAWVPPHQRNHLTAGQVTQTPEWFVKEKDYMKCLSENTSDVRQHLLFKMRDIQKNYEYMNMFCYELYTIMATFAIKKGYKYNMEIHSELLDITFSPSIL